MPDPPAVKDPELLAALSGAALPLHFADTSEGVIVARCRGEQFVALLSVYPWEFEDEDKSDRYPFEHDIAVFARTPDGTFTYESAGGSDWRLGLGQLPRGTPPWLSGFQSGCRFGTFFSGAVSDPGDLNQVLTCGADAAPSAEDAPTGAFVARFRDDDAARAEWDEQLRRPDAHLW